MASRSHCETLTMMLSTNRPAAVPVSRDSATLTRDTPRRVNRSNSSARSFTLRQNPIHRQARFLVLYSFLNVVTHLREGTTVTENEKLQRSEPPPCGSRTKTTALSV